MEGRVVRTCGWRIGLCGHVEGRVIRTCGWRVV